MVDKRGLQSELGTITAAGLTFGTEVDSNMRRYIYKIKTNNQYDGENKLQFGYDDVDHVLDYINHETKGEMWNDPDELTENSLPIYIIPGGSTPYGKADQDSIYVYIEYEDSE